jgi:hypothetical protein
MSSLVITCGRIAFSAALMCASADTARCSDKIKIDVHQSDAAIRQQLLSLTRIGTPIKEVYQFLEYRLQRDGRVVGGPEEPHPFKGALSTHLGHYFEPRNLFLFPTVVQAFWYFDEHVKLQDIQVRRVVSGM